MDMLPEDTTDAFIDQCLDRLRSLPFVRTAVMLGPTSKEMAGDMRLAVTTPSGREVLGCEVRRSHLHRDTAQFVVHLSKQHPDLIVMAPYVGRELGDLFEQAGVNFVDLVGNCYLRLGEAYVARVQGRRAPKRRRSDRGLRAPAYRALFALLVRPTLIHASVRALAVEAGVSPQTASDLRHRLIAQGLVLEAAGTRHWAPGCRKDVIALWLAGFASTLRPSLAIGRFRAPEREPGDFEQRVEPLLDALGPWRYGGGAAAMRLTEYYRGDETVIYLGDAPSDLKASLRLVPDASGPILLARTPGRLAFESPHPRCVHPLLVYADLLGDRHDRARDAAQQLYDDFLVDSDMERDGS